jgi:hypothetical protein
LIYCKVHILCMWTTPRSLNIDWNLNFLHELLIRLNKLYNYGSFPLKKNFRKYHYYKSWKCSLQNFFPTENLCCPIIFYKIFFLTQMFLSGPLFIRTCTCFPVQCSSFSTSLDTDHSASWRFNNSLQSQYFFLNSWIFFWQVVSVVWKVKACLFTEDQPRTETCT